MPDTTTVPQPAEGGSYTRDPVTGELTRVEYTAQPQPSDQATTGQPPAPQTQPEA